MCWRVPAACAPSGSLEGWPSPCCAISAAFQKDPLFGIQPQPFPGWHGICKGDSSFWADGGALAGGGVGGICLQETPAPRGQALLGSWPWEMPKCCGSDECDVESISDSPAAQPERWGSAGGISEIRHEGGEGRCWLRSQGQFASVTSALWGRQTCPLALAKPALWNAPHPQAVEGESAGSDLRAQPIVAAQ